MTPAPAPSPVPAPNPLLALLRSRKFLLMAFDVVLSIVSHFVAEYANVKIQMDVQFLTLALQPVVIVVIGAIAYEDAHQ
jgi:hypothetical protein